MFVLNGIEKSAEKKGDMGSCFELVVSLSPYCDVPLYTLPRIVLPDQLISVCTRNKYIIAEKNR
jgi:hypothetical protein